MPTFNIYQIGQPERQVTVDRPEILIGREEGSDVVLSELLISRRHALLRAQGGRYSIEPLASRNPTVVNGQVLAGPVLLADGDEIQLGCFLLIYSAQGSRGQGRSVRSFHARCAACNRWEGTLAVLSSTPLCPECGSARLIKGKIVEAVEGPPRPGPLRIPPPDLPQKKGLENANTRYLTPADVLAYQERVKRATMAYLVRLPEERSKIKLHSEQVNILSRSKGSRLELEGLLASFGRVEVSWRGAAYTITNRMPFVPMKVNGAKTREARLKSGDLIDIGGLSFRFEVVEE